MIKKIVSVCLMLFILLAAGNAFAELKQLTFEIEGMD